MRTLSDSELAVSVYPTFAYNALGGGGIATAEQHGNIVRLTFDPAAVNIPDVNYRNTTFMGVPMAPPFSIAVQPKQLEVSTKADFTCISRSDVDPFCSSLYNRMPW